MCYQSIENRIAFKDSLDLKIHSLALKSLEKWRKIRKKEAIDNKRLIIGWKQSFNWKTPELIEKEKENLVQLALIHVFS